MKNTESSAVEHPFVQGLKPENRRLAAQGATRKKFSPGEILFREGEPANRCFLIETGKVLLETRTPDHQSIKLEIVHDGDVVGWSWLFQPFCWHFQAEAIEPTTAIVLDGGHLLVTSEENHDFGYDLMSRVTQLLIHRLQSVRQCLVESQGISLKASNQLSEPSPATA